MNRPEGAIRPSGFWIPAKLAAEREHYDAVQEGHIYVYNQSPYRANQGDGALIFGERFNAAIAGRPGLIGNRTSLTVYPGMTGIMENASINVKNRRYTIASVSPM